MSEPKETKLGIGTGMAAGTSSAAAVGTFFLQPPEDHPVYAVIGRIAAEWSQLEHMLDYIIWNLADLQPPMGSCITGQMMGVTPRFKAISALSMHRGLPSGLLDRLQSLSGKTFQVQERRNRIIHDAWYVEGVTNRTSQFRSKTPKEINYGVQHVEQAWIDQTIALIRQRVQDTQELRRDILVALVP